MAPLLSGTDPTEHIMISGELPAKIEFGKFLSKFASDMIKEGKGETLMQHADADRGTVTRAVKR